MPIDQITSASLASGVPTRAQLPAGSVLQVVQGLKTDTFSTSNGTGSPATITGLSATITPTSSSSRILIQANFGEISASGDSTWAIFMFRNGTKIATGDTAGSRALATIAGGVPAGGGAQWRGNNASIMYVDSPATTSALTYTFALGGNGSITIYLNQDGRDSNVANDSARTLSSVILMEIA